VPLSAKQEAAALSLAGGRTAAETVASVGCGLRTLRRWLAEDAEFRGRVEGLRSEMFAAAVGGLAELAQKAARTLGVLLDSETDGIRLQAARSVLEHGPRLREAVDMAAQMAALRQEIEELRREHRHAAARNGFAQAGVAVAGTAARSGPAPGPAPGGPGPRPA
jgi:hypothetical protein